MVSSRSSSAQSKKKISNTKRNSNSRNVSSKTSRDSRFSRYHMMEEEASHLGVEARWGNFNH